MQCRQSAVLLCALVLSPVYAAVAAGPLFVSRPGEVLLLIDRNNDGDYLDALESVVFAEGLSEDIGALTAGGNGVWVLDRGNARIVRLGDLNADGDALDFGEKTLFATIPDIPPASSPQLRGLHRSIDGSLATADATSGVVYRATDFNGDSDALDFAETTIIATGVTMPVALVARADGDALLLQGANASSVSILNDRNHDGDYLDFAEILVYAQASSSAAGLCAMATDMAFTLDATPGRVNELIDTNHDGDALDPGEQRLYAEGLFQPTALAGDRITGDLFVALDDASGTILQLRDVNGDGDALDFGEAIPVAEGVFDVAGLAIPSRQANDCRPGDANGDGRVDANDISAFAGALIGGAGPPPACPLDMNGDNRLDGGDIEGFISAIAP